MTVSARFRNPYFLPGAASVVFHLLLFLLLFLGLFPRIGRFVPDPAKKAPVLVIVPAPVPQAPRAPAAKRHIDTESLLPADRPNPDAPFESDRDTRLASPVPGNAARPLPTLDGRRPSLDLVEKPDAPKPGAQPAPPQQNPAKEQPKPRETAPETEARVNPLKVARLDPQIALPKPREVDTKPFRNPETKPSPPPAPAAQEPGTQGPFSFRQAKSAAEGGAAPQGDASVDAVATPFGKYRANIYRSVGSQWRYMVHKQSALLNYGTVSIRFTIRRDGSLAAMDVRGNNSGSAMLQTISETAIRLCAPFERMPDGIQQQVGETLTLDVDFTIY